jgi:O-antigen/teichoic acid export membrane protein
LKPFDASGAFRSVPEGGGLRRLAVRGAGVTMFAQGTGLAVQIVSTVILARLLAPSDFGLVTMVTTFSLLLVNFGLNGFTEAVLQRDKIDRSLASNLFWINLGTGLLLTLAFAAAGSLMARFYGNARVAHVAVGVSLTIFITSTSVLPLALLMRGMQFTLVSANDFVSRVVSVVVSILAAWAGWGYWALVAGAVAQPLSQSIGAWTLCPWVPSLPRRVAGTGSMVQFAAHVYGRFTLNYASRNMDNLLVGWRFNAVALGFYKKAYDLFALSGLVQSLTSVAVSALSKLKQDPQQYKRYLLRALSVAAFVGMGMGAEFTLIGKDVIRLLLGPGWEPAGRIFTFFGPGMGAMFLYGTHSWIHLSVGRPDRWFRWGIIEFAFTGLLFLIALHWGPAGVATSWSVSLCTLTIPALWYAGRPIDLRVAPMIAAVWKFVAASVGAACATAVIVGRLPSFVAGSDTIGAAERIAKDSLLFGALYLGAVIILHRGIAPLDQIASLLREMVPRAKSSKPSPAFSEATAAARATSML